MSAFHIDKNMCPWRFIQVACFSNTETMACRFGVLINRVLLNQYIRLLHKKAGAPNENIVQNHLNTVLLKVF